MTEDYRAVPAEDVLAELPPERQMRIAERTAELIREELGLSALRKRRQVTQKALAERLGGRQVYISRIEKRGDLKLSTLRDYVRALGGELQLVVSFPDEEFAITATPHNGPARQRGKEPVSASIKRKTA